MKRVWTRWAITPEQVRTEAEFQRRQAIFHEELAGKYRLSAAHPWLPVPPDAPAPE